jgi:hypothetical protein
MRKAAHALDALSAAKFGDILRHVADLCDGEEEGLSLRWELTSTLGALNTQIVELSKKAREMGIEPQQMQDHTGKYPMADLVVAKSEVLIALYRMGPENGEVA